MQTLILNGSPRAHGDTAALLDALRKNLTGEIMEVNCYRDNISACTDCRYCVTRSGCAIQDDMQKVYPFLETCDNIIIASPVYFSLPTPPVLSVASRLQPYFCARFMRGEANPIQPKRGAILLAGGGMGSVDPAETALRRILRAMNAKDILPSVRSTSTDHIPACEDFEALAAAAACGQMLSEMPPLTLP